MMLVFGSSYLWSSLIALHSIVRFSYYWKNLFLDALFLPFRYPKEYEKSYSTLQNTLTSRETSHLLSHSYVCLYGSSSFLVKLLANIANPPEFQCLPSVALAISHCSEVGNTKGNDYNLTKQIDSGYKTSTRNCYKP